MFKAVNPVMLGLLIVLAPGLGLAGCSPANSISQPASTPPTTTPQPGTPLESEPVPETGTVSETGTVPETGTLRPFLEPEADHEPVLAALGGAKRSVRMEMYLLTDSYVIDALKEARRRGLDVRVLLEAQPVGVGTGNSPAIIELQAAGVSVKTTDPAYRLTRAKSIIIDERLAFIMTLNQTRSAFTGNREFGIIDSEPADVAEVLAVFEADWNRTAPALSNPNLVWSPINTRQRLLAFMDGAKRTLDIEAEEMQDAEVEDHLMAAVQRGVAVRLIMSPSQSAPDANAPGQARLMRAGVQLKFVKTPYIHAQMMVADGQRGFVGSQNFSPESLDVYRELGIVISDKRVVDGLAGTFLVDWNIGRQAILVTGMD